MRTKYIKNSGQYYITNTIDTQCDKYKLIFLTNQNVKRNMILTRKRCNIGDREFVNNYLVSNTHTGDTFTCETFVRKPSAQYQM